MQQHCRCSVLLSPQLTFLLQLTLGKPVIRPLIGGTTYHLLLQCHHIHQAQPQLLLQVGCYNTHQPAATLQRFGNA